MFGIWLAFALRLYRLGEQSLWYDELVTVNSIFTFNLDPAWSEGRSLFHVYLITPIALLIPNEFGYRWLSMAAGVLAVAAMYQVGKRMADHRAGVFAAIGLALSPFFVYYSQEARSYSVLSLFSVLTLWQIAIKRPRWTYPLSAGMLTLLHIYSTPWILTQIGLVAFRRWRRGVGASWRIIIGSVAAVIAADAVIIALELYKGRGELSIPQFDTFRISYIVPTVIANGFGLRIKDEATLPYLLILGLVAVLTAILAWGVIRRHREYDLMLACLWTLSLAAMITATYFIPGIWQMRYCAPILATWIALAGVGFAGTFPRWIGTGGFIAASLAAALLTSAVLTQPRFFRDDWRSAIEYMSAHIASGDYVYPCQSFAGQALIYYVPDQPFQRLGSEYANHPVPYPPTPTIVPQTVKRAWLLGIDERPCTFEAYGRTAPYLNDEPSLEQHYESVVLLLYEQK